MASDTGDSIGVNERLTSELLALEEQIEQNIKDFEAFEAQRLVVETEHNKIDSSFERSEEAESDDSESHSVESDAEAKLLPQRSTRSQSSASATRKQHLLEGTVHQPPGGTVLCNVHRLPFKGQQAPETDENEDVDASTSDEHGSETEQQSQLHDLDPRKKNSSEQIDGSFKEEPHVEATVIVNPQQWHNEEATEAVSSPKAESPNIASTLDPADQNMSETYPSSETVAFPSEYDRAVNIVEKMDPAHLPQSADLQGLLDEVKKPTKPNADNDVDEDNYCLRCSICCKCKGKPFELGYKCAKEKCTVLTKGFVSVFQYWNDGFTPRWKLFVMVGKIVMYVLLIVVAAVSFCIDLQQGQNIAFDCICFVFSCCGIIVPLLYALYFCIRRRREVCIAIREFCIAIPGFCTCVALFFYKCCCCCCTIEWLEELKEHEKIKKNGKHEKAEKYVSEMQKFKPAQNRFEKFTALVGNTSEVLLTIVDDVILTVVFILSLYSFIGKQKFTLFYGSVRAGNIVSIVFLVLSTLKLIILVHGLRFISIAVNVRALDKKIEMDSDDMKFKLPNKFIRYFLSFQSRLVFHGLASSAFQLYGIFALSWKIIQDSCSAVTGPSIPMGNGTNGSYNASLVSPGAPFTCNLHPMVNGFTIYNILYIAIAPTLLGYTSFFVCNTPWLVEYLQTIEMWTYFNIACTAGYRVRTKRKNDEVARRGKVAGCCMCFQNCEQDEVCQDGGQVEVIKDGGQGEVRQDGDGQDEVVKDGGGQDVVGKAAGDAKLCKISEKDSYMSPMLQLVRIFGGDLLCDVTDDELCEVGANAERVRQAIQEDHAVSFGTNFVSRAVTIFVPGAIIGALQVILFIVHLSFMGCCINGDVHTVFSPSVLTDAAVVLVPLIVLFLLTSAPGPWMGLFWIFVVVGIIATVIVLVAMVVPLVVVGFVAIVLCFMLVCMCSCFAIGE